MKKRLHVIYITGLGDKSPGNQRMAIRSWRLWGVEPELFQVDWGNGEAWHPKLTRLLARIDAAAKNGPVALVGVSAGAGAAINAFAARKEVVSGVVLIAGKVNNPEAIGPKYRKYSSAFIASAYDCVPALGSLEVEDRRRIMSRYAVFDGVVAKRDSKIAGANNRVVPSLGHVPTIATQITLGAPGFLRFLKKQAVDYNKR